MPKYYGCPCEGCGEPLTLRDDIVVCPDCGAPYHRTCYEKLGRCIHSPAHAAGYEWKFPYQENELRTCPNCGERTLRNDRAEESQSFDYANFYRQFEEGNVPDPLKQAYQAAFGKEEQLDGIPCKDWNAYIGPAAPSYMTTYSRMELTHSKVAMSFSALLFGPFYFFYRKAWKPAFGFLAAELLLSAPYFIDMLQITGSTLSPGLSDSALLLLSRVCSFLGFLLMVLRGMYGKWFYRQSAAARIRRIQSEFPDAEQRRAVLSAQGGTSLAAVLGSLALLCVLGSAFTLLLGPNLQALIDIVSG